MKTKQTHPRAVGGVTGVVSVPRADQRGQSLPEGTPGSHPWVTVPAGGKPRQDPTQRPPAQTIDLSSK